MFYFNKHHMLHDTGNFAKIYDGYHDYFPVVVLFDLHNRLRSDSLLIFSRSIGPSDFRQPAIATYALQCISSEFLFVPPSLGFNVVRIRFCRIPTEPLKPHRHNNGINLANEDSFAAHVRAGLACRLCGYVAIIIARVYRLYFLLLLLLFKSTGRRAN